MQRLGAFLVLGLVAVGCEPLVTHTVAPGPYSTRVVASTTANSPIDLKTHDGLALTKAYKSRPAHTEYAAFAAGCFWGVEELFRREPGVVATAVGFAGGHVKNPSYEDVCTDKTGHAETALVEFDPAKTSYAKLLKVFWEMHDPTEGNRQGPDVGTQYRSVIFAYSPAQKSEAEATKKLLTKSNEFGAPITTEIVTAGPVYRAEDYHQQYIEKGNPAYCHTRTPRKALGGAG